MVALKKNFGFINVDKPVGITSHDVVNKIRRILGFKHVGHGGTLDPLAQGVLPIAVGAACRLLRFLPQDKTYVAEILLGEKRTTDDIEGDVIATGDGTCFSADQIVTALQIFTGCIDQVPPFFSAVHIEGKRSYEFARAGNTSVQIKPRQVTIHHLEVLAVSLPLVKVRISCSSGTYIRSIARDLGENLGCGGCLKSLVREQAGLFALAQSHTLEQIAAQKEDLENILIDPLTVLQHSNHFNRIAVNADMARKLAMGQVVPLNLLSAEQIESDKPILITHEDDLIAVCNLTADQLIKPEVVIVDAQRKD